MEGEAKMRESIQSVLEIVACGVVWAAVYVSVVAVALGLIR